MPGRGEEPDGSDSIPCLTRRGLGAEWLTGNVGPVGREKARVPCIPWLMKDTRRQRYASYGHGVPPLFRRSLLPSRSSAAARESASECSGSAGLVEDVLPCSPEQFLVYANHACTSIDRGLHTVCRAHLFLVKTIAEI